MILPTLRSIALLFGVVSVLLGEQSNPSVPLTQDSKLMVPKYHEKAAMNQVKSDASFSMMGAWDEEGRPFIKDLCYMTRWNPDTFQLYMGSTLRAEFKSPKGNIENKGITLLEASKGSNRGWSSHFALPFPLDGDVASFRILGPGFKPLLVKLEWNDPGDPRLRLWEEGDQLRWEVKEAWFVQVDVTVNDGESWITVGRGNEGLADLNPYKGRDPVVRVQAWRGLRCYLDAFEPGLGILGAPWSYLRPTFFHEGTKENGQATLSRYPNFHFAAVRSGLPSDYVGKVKVHLHWKRLPFDPEKFFPGKCIQKVFQAEWKNLPKWPRPSMTIDASLLLHPGRTNGMKLYRVMKSPGGIWAPSLFFSLKQREEKPPYASDYDFDGGIINSLDPKTLKVDFDSYWILVSD